MKLLRVPGREIVANFDLVDSPKVTKADPNGYYRTLGLDPSKDYTDEAVQKAYWVKAKRLHPDGSAPDEEAFRRVQAAYDVLKDPDSREKYDSLDTNHRWLDEEVISALLKRMIPEDMRKDGLNHLIQQLDPKYKIIEEKIAPPPKAAFDGFAYYYYEGEEVPPRDVREEWVRLLVQAMYDKSLRGSVKLGFTPGPSHLINKKWGDIIMVAGDPSINEISSILDFMDFRSPGDS